MSTDYAIRAATTDRTIRVGRAREYPKEVWYLIAAFLFLVAVLQHGLCLVSKLLRRRVPPAVSDPAALHHRYSLRRLPIALVNVYRVAAFRWTIQIGSAYTLNMAEVFVTCAYIIAIFVWEFGFTTDLEGEKLDMTYWGNRAGTIAACQFPLLTALGTKNNIVSYITGIGADKLNYVHRMVARVMFILLWVHGGAKLSTLCPAEWDGYFVRSGLTAMVGFSILVAISLRPIRSRAYELFFITHFLMVLVVLIGGYYHVRFQGMGYYLWPCFFIWGLDRLIRAASLVTFNHLYFSFSPRKRDLNGIAELLSPQCVRLRVWRPPHLRWRAGQTAFLTLPGVSALPWEAHPFSIASVACATPAGGSEKRRAQGPPGWTELVFLIHVRAGFTRRLARMAQRGAQVTVLVDGPYGFVPRLAGDDAVVLVAGGSGVSYTLATFLGVVQAARDGTSACRKLVFLWMVRDPGHIEWASDALAHALDGAPAHLAIAIRIFVTAGEAAAPGAWKGAQTSASESGSSSPTMRGAAPVLLGYPMVEVAHGRPDLVRVLREEAAVSTRRMSVTVCGSQAIVRACRAALGVPVSGPAAVMKGGPSVVLHVESFGYA